jgi:hypothetical protein
VIRRLVLTSNRELDISTQRLVRRLARRLNLTRLFVGLIVELVAGLIIGGLVVVELLFARGLVGRSFVVNNSKSRSLWRRVFKDTTSLFNIIKAMIDVFKSGSYLFAH